MENLVRQLTKQGLTISSCESFTVGNFGAKIGSISGASKVYQGSLICYNTTIKIDVLGVAASLVKQYGVVSYEVAKEMCRNGRQFFNSDICISFTGNAGPSAMENKPVGLVYIGINYLDEIEVLECHLSGRRFEIVNEAIDIALNNILNKIK